MELSIKEKILISIIGAVLVAAVSGSVWALTANRGANDMESSTAAQQEKTSSSVKDETDASSKDDELDNSTDADNKPSTDSAPQSSTPASSSSQNPSSTSPSTSQQKSANSSDSTSTSQQTVPSQQVAECDKDMKALYTGSRDASIARENARWTKQQNDINEEAVRRGGAHSGFAQAMINDARPVHEANLADIEIQYQYNLLSINC